MSSVDRTSSVPTSLFLSLTVGLAILLSAGCALPTADTATQCIDDADCPIGSTCLAGWCRGDDVFGEDTNVPDQGSNPALCGEALCDGGQSCCEGRCVNTNLDETNCGACDVVCAEGRTCESGICQCQAGLADCDAIADCETDLKTDTLNCGACNSRCLSTAMECSAQQCFCGDVICRDGEDCCGDACIDTLSSRTHCGGCGVACGAGEICLQGVCVCGQSETGAGVGTGVACQPGTICCQESCVPAADKLCQCGAQGEGTTCTATEFCCDDNCVDVNVDGGNCGSCGAACADAQHCADGSCRCPDTAPNFCDDNCVDVTFDTANCGSCGTACVPGSECCSGSCASLDSDPLNCGGCGNVCGNGQACCDGSCVDLNRDGAHCGACGTDCGGTPSECCDGACANLKTNESNCGACGRVCPLSTYCDAGMCRQIEPGGPIPKDDPRIMLPNMP